MSDEKKSPLDDWSNASLVGLTDGEVGAKCNPDKYGLKGKDKEDYETAYETGKTLPTGSGNLKRSST